MSKLINPNYSLFLLIALTTCVPAQAGGPYVIHTISPCRVVDTRFADPVQSTFSGNKLGPAETVAFFATADQIDGQGGETDCGIPLTARGVFANIVAVRPQGTAVGGYMTLYPYAEGRPTASTINFNINTIAVANGVLLPLCDPVVNTCDYDLNVYNNHTLAVDLIIDVTGYLTD